MNNIEYSVEWLTKEIIKTSFEEKESGKKQYYNIGKIELLRMFLKFAKMNKEDL